MRDRILDALDVHDAGHELAICISLTLPVRYVRYLPPDTGRELRVKLQAVAASPLERDILPGRETLAPQARTAAVAAGVMRGRYRRRAMPDCGFLLIPCNTAWSKIVIHED